MRDKAVISPGSDFPGLPSVISTSRCLSSLWKEIGWVRELGVIQLCSFLFHHMFITKSKSPGLLGWAV